MNYKHKITFLLSFFITLLSFNAHAQLKPGGLVDGIAAVVGNEIVLESDIEQQENYARQQGAQTANRCEFLEKVLSNKLLIYEAKKDTLIENHSEAIKQQAEAKYNELLAQFPSEKELLAAYKFRNSFEMKSAIEQIDTDQYYGQAKYQRITSGVNITPNEVTDFYNIYKGQLPMVKDEISLAKITLYPKLTKEHQQKLIDKLNQIKKDIEGGESFEKMARIYSEDPGSAATGGLYKNIAKGAMVKAFEAAALNLQEGELSKPIESEFGYHLIQLIKKSGKFYDARHILLKAEPNTEEIAAAKKELNEIRKQIEDGKITFKEAAYKYSDDKATKFNAGVISTPGGSDRLEKLHLPANYSYQIVGLKVGDITEAFEDVADRDKKVVSIVKVLEEIPAHSLDLTSDYERIKNYALEQKKGKVMEKWIVEKLPDTFISIDGRYKSCQFDVDWNKQALTK
ncbi:peptidylprolyl isomerase [Riemerella anatipestifer]|uniref:peptidylprolyl isomerase n=1 Tax=Riemerella anatipestifer TaxID=34085 RepID=UPI0021D5D791|nr:peptidylprolyl isomerase [Riemerella anatipestifer]MCU7575416.1 peptidylprolyl isomerase [Riemerella anatipestifer]MCU7596615.1 peptidylprolyl isomerase [Riemerella anatipestifer]MDR7635609.1 peptidylprolyl isomerase [Riemerella anatipestifer]MDR7685552.1 peptidylprolyl isomerase [Riemerella anatipestifer]MDR7734394.1 peptidylprolyl isomerase [Riemerella anatipestifer]